jgi:site-specific recombinase XerD
MSVLFNHGIRHEICDRNPIQLVRQSAKRKAIPVILSATEVQKLIAVLGIRERTLGKRQAVRPSTWLTKRC